MKIETIGIHATKDPHEEVQAVSAPIYLSTTFIRNEDGAFTNDYRYSVIDNPNRRNLESTLARLENGACACAFASGMAAINAIFQSLSPGDHVLIPEDVFVNVGKISNGIYKRWGLQFTAVNMSETEEVRKAFKSNTKLVWIESPSNPRLKMSDIRQISELAKGQGSIVVVDNTWLSPVLLNPLDLGADIVVHSTTKFFGGHSDVIGGALIFKENSAMQVRIKEIQILNGAIPSPFDCWLINRGVKTLALRVKTQAKSALQLALFLENHSKIRKVYYPGLESFEYSELAQKQLKNGFGSMLSVLVEGAAEEAIKISNALNIFARATSLGGVESLVEHRQSVEGESSTSPSNLLRISVGLEHINDLIEDWNQALK